MGITCKRRPDAAFTLLELVVMVTIVFLLVAFVLPAMRPRGTRAGRIKCVNNLKNVGLAFRIFATDNQDQFPMNISTNSGGSSEYATAANQNYVFAHFQSLSNELSTPKIVLCPSDSGKSESTNF